MYVNSINYFRGIAITCIVIGHCFGLSDFAFETNLGNTFFNLLKGGTHFFVFISGFLFHLVYYNSYNSNDFMIKKSKSVLLPYFILSSIPILYLIIRLVLARLSLFGDYETRLEKNRFISYFESFFYR